jgi:hypothetical protein
MRAWTLLAVASLLIARAAAAECDCAGVSRKESFECHREVFIGTVVSGSGFPIPAEVRVGEVFKGRLDDTVEVVSGPSCALSLEEGATYLFETFAGDDGAVTTSVCSFTRRVDEPGVAEAIRLIRRRAWWWRLPFDGWCRNR